MPPTLDRERLCDRLGIDPTSTVATITAAVDRLAQKGKRAEERSFEDADPTGILGLVPMPSERATTPTAPGSIRTDSAIDDAITRGAIPMEDRPLWRARLERDYETVADVLDELPGDPAETERAHQRDPRLRDLADGLDALTGVTRDERVREFAEVELLPISQQMEHRLDALTNAHLFR